MSFWSELKRRNVFKVGVAYVIVAWLIVQVANTFFPILHLPDWAVTLVAVLLLFGLPVTLIIAWAFELTPEGVKRSENVPLDESITHVTGRKLNYVLAGLIIVLVGYIVIDKVFIGQGSVESEVASTVTEQIPASVDVKEAPKTIAVLPFDDLSPEKDQEYFVDGLSEEILNSLAKIPDLRVIAKTSSFSFKGKDKTIQDIADVLGADHILEGSVRKAGNKLRITAQLIRAENGIHLWSETYNRELKDIFDVQEDLATAVANELKVTLGIGEALKQLGGTDNLEAYELYLVAQGQLNARFDMALLNRAMDSVDAALSKDPTFSLAWVAKARIHSFLKIFGLADQTLFEQEEGLSAALKAIELEPNLAPAYYALGMLKSSIADFIEAESAFHKALDLTSEPLSGSEMMIGTHYNTVGNFERAYEILEEIHRNDPLDQDARTHYMLNFALRGDLQGAENEYKRGMALFEQQWDWGDDFIANIRLLSGSPMSREKIVKPPGIIWDAAKEYLESPEEGLAELRRIYDAGDNLKTADVGDIMLWAAYFGDTEFALDIMENLLRHEASGNFWVWLPVFKQMRQLPRFKELIRDIGLVDYWKKFGWPDICQPTEDGDFVCD